MVLILVALKEQIPCTLRWDKIRSCSQWVAHKVLFHSNFLRLFLRSLLCSKTNWAKYGWELSWGNLRHCLGINVEGLRKATVNLRTVSWQGFQPGTSETQVRSGTAWNKLLCFCFHAITCSPHGKIFETKVISVNRVYRVTLLIFVTQPTKFIKLGKLGSGPRLAPKVPCRYIRNGEL